MGLEDKKRYRFLEDHTGSWLYYLKGIYKIRLYYCIYLKKYFKTIQCIQILLCKFVTIIDTWTMLFYNIRNLWMFVMCACDFSFINLVSLHHADLTDSDLKPPTDIIISNNLQQGALISFNKPSWSDYIKWKSILAPVAPVIFVYLKAMCNYYPTVSERDSLQLINYEE